MTDNPNYGLCVVGIDPGVTGGLAFLFPDYVVCDDIPNVGGEVDIDLLVRRLKNFAPLAAFIERASSMPGQGVVSTFKFGMAYGAIRAAVAASEIPSYIISPVKWKKHFGLSKDKELSRAMAIRLWPGCGFFERKMDHGRAEAALIARYGIDVLLSAEARAA